MKKNSRSMKGFLAAAVFLLSLSMPVSAGADTGGAQAPRLKKLTLTNDVSNSIGEYGAYSAITKTYDYDNNGRVSNMTVYEGDSKLMMTESYEYDANGNMIKKVPDHHQDWFRDVMFTYGYDEHGNEVTFQESGPDVTTVVNYNLTYDDSGNMIKKESLTSHAYDIYGYDSSGNLLSVEHYSFSYGKDRMTTAKYYSDYDSHGNYLSSSEWIAGVSSTNKFTHTYQYDENGNPTKQDIVVRYGTNVKHITYSYEYE